MIMGVKSPLIYLKNRRPAGGIRHVKYVKKWQWGDSIKLENKKHLKCLTTGEWVSRHIFIKKKWQNADHYQIHIKILTYRCDLRIAFVEHLV